MFKINKKYYIIHNNRIHKAHTIRYFGTLFGISGTLAYLGVTPFILLVIKMANIHNIKYMFKLR